MKTVGKGCSLHFLDSAEFMEVLTNATIKAASISKS